MKNQTTRVETAFRQFLAISAIGLLMGTPVHGATWPLPTTTPAKAGFSADRLERLHSYCEGLITNKQYSGVTVLLARDGRILEWRSFGYRDRAAAQPLGSNDLFSVASLTKLVTTVGVLTLVEEGKLTLREPLTKYLPEFEHMKVFKGGTVENPVLVDAARPLTLHDLLTHTAGFFGGPQPGANPVLAELWKRTPQSPQTLNEMADRLAKFPFQAQPGEAWIYGPSTDLIGALIERVSGQKFEQFLAERIFQPLQMRDTAFAVPDSKRARQVNMDSRQTDGSLKSEAPRQRNGPWPSGAGGLFSTQGDYIRFAQMLLNRGEFGGVRILSPKTIDLMTHDHLHGLAKPTKIYPESDGFGLGVEIRTDLARGEWLGSEGTFGWNGATTAYCAIDPKEKLIAMIWAQHRPNAEFELYERFNNLVYQALIAPK